MFFKKFFLINENKVAYYFHMDDHGADGGILVHFWWWVLMLGHRTIQSLYFKWNFKVYDADGSGTLEREELVFFISRVYQSTVNLN